jgi:hypothetical protein
MKIIVRVLILVFLLLNQLSLLSQSNAERKYVKIIVEGVNSNKEADFIDRIIRLKPGVITSRMDDRTNLYYGIYKTSSGLSLNHFKQWILDVGFTIKCAVEGDHGNGKSIQLSELDCRVNDGNLHSLK